MATYENLNPDPLFLNPESGTQRTFSPLSTSLDDVSQWGRPRTEFDFSNPDPLDTTRPMFDQDDVDKTDDEDASPSPSVVDPGNPLALHNIGVKFDTGPSVPANRDFYNVDVDKPGKDADPDKPVEHANVFGRVFSREELEKDSEGVRLVSLMEAARSGKYLDDGFWSGLTDFSDLSGSWKKSIADIPFIGWMVDGGMTIGETIDMSRTMRKIQNGEKVSDHEAIAVRRFMLQQEMESRRGIGYTAGSLVHSSIPFMFEMALSSSMISGSMAAGAFIGNLIAPVVGAGVGGAIGAGVGGALSLIFGGGKLLSKTLGKLGRKTAETGTRRGLLELFEKSIGTPDYNRATATAIRKKASEALGMGEKELMSSARSKAYGEVMADMGREIAARNPSIGAEAAKKLDSRVAQEIFANSVTPELKKEARRRATEKAYRSVAEAADSVFAPEKYDVGLATKHLLNADVESQIFRGFESFVEHEALGALDTPVSKKALRWYWSARAAKKRGLEKLVGADPKFLENAAKRYSEGVVATLHNGANATPLDLVIDSMNRALGNGAVISNGLAKKVLDRTVNASARSMMLKYGVGEGAKHGAFVNNSERFARWFADGILDGLLRWDTSMFGAVGTIARSGTELGGKMNVLKEALKCSFIEAPVRGAMQLSMQTPLWPIGSVLSGNGLSDFVIKGQLGIQAQALQTGDRDMMEHARAIAFGSGLVEYVSENAGRGFNMSMGGIVKPAVINALPTPVKRVGSTLARKVEAVFGSETDMISKNADMLADSALARIQTLASRKGARLPSITRDDLLRFVKTRSASGIGPLESALSTLGVSGGELMRDAIGQTITHGKLSAACLYFTAFYMMKNGLTPQKFADLLQRVGYDGVISEMAEERYGGFFQGLLALNDRPSDEGFKGRMKAAMEGLFPDKNQLITEAIGFAVPSITHATFNRAYSHLAQGSVAGWRRDVATLNIGMNASTELNLPVDSPEYVSKLNEWRDKRAEVRNGRFGTVESNEAAISGKAGSVIGRIKSGDLEVTEDNKQLADISDEDKMKSHLLKLARMAVTNSNNDEDLEGWISKYGLVDVLGEDGVEAIRNLATHKQGFKSEALDKFYQSEEWTSLPDAPMPSGVSDTDVEDVVNRITMSVPVLADDMSALADIRKRANAVSARTEATAGRYKDNLRDALCDAASRIGDALLRSEHGLSFERPTGTFGKLKSMAYRGLARFVGVMDAVVTGDLSLAASNPVMWALADESLDKDFASEILLRKKASVITGAERVLSRNRDLVLKIVGSQNEKVNRLLSTITENETYAAEADNEIEAADARDNADYARKELSRYLEDFVRNNMSDGKFMDGLDSDLLDQFIAAGEEDFRERLRPFISAFMTAKNVLDVSRSDLSAAAGQVAAARAKKNGAEVTADDVSNAKRDIVQALVRMASDNMIGVNTSARFSVSNSTSVSINLERAMAAGTESEILAAIQTMPAFSYIPAIHNLTGGNLIGEDVVGAFGRTIDLEDILSMPKTGDLEPEDLRKILPVMGNSFAGRSERENQAAARRLVDQVRTLVEYNLPTVHRDKTGNEIKVTYSRVPGGVSATVWDKSNPAYETEVLPTVSDVLDVLRLGGIRAELRKVVFMKNSRLVSEDAVSVMLTCMTRNQARDYMLANGVAEDDLPPYLQYKPGTVDFMYGIDEAMDLMRKEMALANSVDDTGSPEFEAARLRVYGSEDSDSSETRVVGYERLAARFLESLGHKRVTASGPLATVGVKGSVWVISPSSLNFGPVMYVTSDYFSSGDSEAILRASVRSALYHAFADGRGIGGNSHSGVASLFNAVSDDFDDAIDEIISENSGKPDVVERMDQLRTSFRDNVPGRIKLDKLAAVVTSTAFLTCDRGVSDPGNGFLMSPELALVADKLRSGNYPAIVPFLSVVDKALGGTGAFDGGLPFPALRAIAKTFSPSADSIIAARTTSMFYPESSGKPPIMVTSITPGEVTVGPDGRNSMSQVSWRGVDVNFSDTPFMGVETMLDVMGGPCAELYHKYVDSKCGDVLTEEEVFSMLARATDMGGDTSSGPRAQVVLGRTAGSGNARRYGSAVVKAVQTEVVRPSTSDVISEVDAVSFGRNLSFLVPAESSVSENFDEFGHLSDNAGLDRSDEITSARSKMRSMAMAGTMTEVEARVVASDSRFRDSVVSFLMSRGMDTDSIDKVMEMLPVALSSTSYVVDKNGEDVERDPDDETRTEQDELNDAVDEGANLESWFDAQKARDAVDNKDLLEIGKTFVHLFPREKRNHMAVFARMVADFSRMADAVRDVVNTELSVVAPEADADPTDTRRIEETNRKSVRDRENMRNFVMLSDALNVLRGRLDADSMTAVSNAERFEDPKLLEYRITRAIDYLVSEGHLEYAYVLNAIRRIGDDVKRTKALENIAYFNRVDARASYVDVSEDGDVGFDARPIGSSSTGCEDAVKACMSGFFHAVDELQGYTTAYKYLDDLRSALVVGSFQSRHGRAKDFYYKILQHVQETRGASASAFSTLVHEMFPSHYDVREEVGEDGHRRVVAAGLLSEGADDPVYVPPKAPSYRTVVAAQKFADAFVKRMSAMADAVDTICGTGNELAAALRNPEMKVQVLKEIYDVVLKKNNKKYTTSQYLEKQLGFLQNRIGDMYTRSFRKKETSYKEGKGKSEFTHECYLLEELLYAPMAHAVRTAYGLDYTGDDAPDFRETVSDLISNSDLVPVFARCRISTPAGSVADSSRRGGTVTWSTSTGRAWSPFATLFQWMEAGAARSTVRVKGVTSDQFSDAGQSIGCPPSPPVEQSRIEDNLLTVIPDVDYYGNVKEGQVSDDGSVPSVYSSYIANGQRFADGSRLVCTSAGAAVGGEIQDGAAVSRIVFHSNVDKYVENGDMRNFLFQLYHGEKPTVNSIQLPGNVCERMYRDILDGVGYTVNPVTRRILGSLKDSSLSDISEPDERRLAYDALFSVVSYHAACSEIDSKRVQVLLSQGIPFSGHRDFYSTVETVDGEDTEVSHSYKSVRMGEDGSGDAVVPATRFVIGISGATATSDLGMYFCHGRLVEAQRSISTNPDAVSFKNHLTDWTGSSLTKGQGHDIAIGLDEDEETPLSGEMLKAQECMRREIETAMGFSKGSLDRLDADVLDAARRGDEAAAAKVEKRKGLVERAKEFLKFSTVVYTDMETQKSGPFSSRCGFYAPSSSDAMTMRVAGKEFMMREAKEDGRKRLVYSVDGGSTWSDVPAGRTAPEFKNGSWNIAMSVTTAMSCLGIDSLSSEEFGAIEADIMTADGEHEVRTIAESGMFHDYGNKDKAGDEVQVSDDGRGGYIVRYASRSVIGQIMANADASATTNNDHPAATNYVRDLVANQAYRMLVSSDDIPVSAAAIATVARAVPMCLMKADKNVLNEYLMSNPDFARKVASNPLSGTARHQMSLKTNSMLAKIMRVYPNSTHAVLLGNGRMAKECLDIENHTFTTPDETNGVNDYDRDSTRPARIVTSAATKALRRLYNVGERKYAVDRTYSSGLVNIDVSEDHGDPSFRYGWHLDDAAMEALGDPFSDRIVADRFKDMPAGKHGSIMDVMKSYLEVAREVYAREKSDIPGVTAESEARKAAVVAGLVYGAKHWNRECRTIVGGLFKDYTGRLVSDSPACTLDKVSFDDLFIEDEFDFLALEVGGHRKIERNAEEGGNPTIYLGGSFFSGDRRPSGNYEAAGGLARAQAPVTMKPDMTPGKTAMYILDPVQSAVQGSDTDGDSACLIKMLGYAPTSIEAENVRSMFDFFRGRTFKEDGEGRRLRNPKITDGDAEEFFDLFGKNAAFESLFKMTTTDGRKSIEILPAFGEVLGNMLFQIQIDNYRMIEAREITSRPGEAVRRAVDMADESDADLYDIGFSGRRPVGPNVMSDSAVPADDVNVRNMYRKYVGSDMPAGMSYSKAFKECVNAISVKAGFSLDLELLDPEKSAFLSSSAADASSARGVMVALQATIEHLDGLAAYGDEGLVKMCPALFTRYVSENGDVIYDPCREFVSHLDGISNALFDVVKDLFAPRAGWNKDMLNYMIGMLLKDANDEFRRRADPANGLPPQFYMRFNDSWFFTRLVTYANDYMTVEDSIPGLMKKMNAGNNYLFSEKFGAGEERTMRGMALDANAQGGDTVLRYFAELMDDYGDKSFADTLQEIVDTVGTDFEVKYERWVRRLSREISSKPGTTKLLNMFRAGTLHPSVRTAVLSAVDGNADLEPEAAAKRFFENVGDIMSSAGAAAASHLLFGDLGSFQSRLSAVSTAAEAESELSMMQDVNGAVSPEKAFRSSGEKAVTMTKRIARSKDMVSLSDDLFHVQSFVNGTRLIEQAREFSPVTMARAVKSSVNGLEDVLLSRDASLSYYFEHSGMFLPFKSESEFKTISAAMMHASGYVADGVVAANRARMGAIMAAVAYGVTHNGGRHRFVSLVRSFYDALSCGDDAVSDRVTDRNEQSTRKSVEDEVFDMLDGNSYDDVSDVFHGNAGKSILAKLVYAALQRSQNLPISTRFFLQHINVTEDTESISLESKLAPYGSAVLMDGFHEMLADDRPVVDVLGLGEGALTSAYMFPSSVENDMLTMSDVAVLIWLRLAATQEFDSIRESDTRVDMTNMFSVSELRLMERFGYAAEHSLAGRALMCVPQTKSGEYDLLRLPGYRDRTPSGRWLKSFVSKMEDVGLTSLSKYKDEVLCEKFMSSLKDKIKDVWSPVGKDGKVSEFSPLNLIVDLVSDENGSFMRECMADALAAETYVRKAREHETGTSSDVETTVVSTYADFVFDGDNLHEIDMLNEAPDEATKAPFGFIGRGGVRYDSVEEAVNSYAEAAVEAYRKSVGDAPKNTAVDGTDELLMYVSGYSDFRAEPSAIAADGKNVGNTLSLSATIDCVLRDTVGKNGIVNVGKWLHRVMTKKLLSPVVHPLVREKLNKLYRQTPQYEVDKMAKFFGIEIGKAQVGVDLGGDSAVAVDADETPVVGRMTRSSFSTLIAGHEDTANRNVNTFESIKFALETAFGVSDGSKGKTGVTVTNVTVNHSGVEIPSNVVRVDRYIKVRDGSETKIRKVVMYISFGDAIRMERTEEIMKSFLRAINDGSRTKVTMDQLRQLTDEQLEILLRSSGAAVNGMSGSLEDAGVDTKGLMMLTGLVRLGSGADYVTLFHEYFHQMLGFCRATGLVSPTEMAELERMYSVGGEFDEETAAEEFAEFVAGKTRGVSGRLAKGLSDPDRPKLRDELFDRFFLTAQALLAGATAFDQNGVPVFMRMIVTGDFSDRAIGGRKPKRNRKTEDLTAAAVRNIEAQLLSGDADIDVSGMEGEIPEFGRYFHASGPVVESESEVRLALSRMRNGDASFADVVNALPAVQKADTPDNAPKFTPSTEPFGDKVPEVKAGPTPSASPSTEISTVGPGSEGVRLHAILDAAMTAFRKGDGMTDEEREAMELLYKRVSVTEDVSYDEFDLIVGVAARVLREACRTLGVSYDKWVSEWTRDGFRPEFGRNTVRSVTMPSSGKKVDFYEQTHRYETTDDAGTIRYASGTGIIKAFSGDFEKTNRFLTAPDNVRRAWQATTEQASRFGTMIHTVYEDVFNAKGGTVHLRAAPSSQRERAAVERAKLIAKAFADNYEFVAAEVIVADPVSKVAGTIDLVLRDKDGNLVLVDHKTNQFIGRKAFGAERMKGKMSSFEDSDFNHYALQLNLYRELLRRSGMFGVTGDTRISLMINHFPGHDRESMKTAADKAANRVENPNVVVDYEIIADSDAAKTLSAEMAGSLSSDVLPDMSKEAAAVLKFAEEHPSAVPRSGSEASRKAPLRRGDAHLVAELAVRIAHSVIGNAVTRDENGKPVKSDMRAPEIYGKLDYLIGTAFAQADPSGWYDAVVNVHSTARVELQNAADDMRKRARAYPDKADALNAKAAQYEEAAFKLRSVVDVVSRGGDVRKFVPAAVLAAGTDLYDSLFRYVFGGIRGVLSNDGTIAYEADGEAAVDPEGRSAQQGIDAGAQAIGMSVAVGKYVAENGLGPVGPGFSPKVSYEGLKPAQVNIPEHPVSLDVTPQMILQSQTSWMASDLMNGFYGTNLRDVMTDSSRQALAEETNRTTNFIDFMIGADVCPGGRLRVMEDGTSDLGRTDNGLFEIDKAHRHHVVKAAGTRGYAMGLVTRAAEKTGDPLTIDDVNLINIVGQMIGSIVNGDGMLVTGYDISSDQINRLGLVLGGRASALVAENEVEGKPHVGFYNPARVMKRVANGEAGTAVGDERPTNLDILLHRILVSGLSSGVTGCSVDEKGIPTGKCREDGLYCAVLSAVREAVQMVPESKRNDSSLIRKYIVDNMVRKELAIMSNDNKAFLVVPKKFVEDAWNRRSTDGKSKTTMDKLVDAGRTQSFLSIGYLADIVQTEAHRLNEIAVRSRFMKSSIYSPLAGIPDNCLWFESGSGHHGLVVQEYMSAREAFGMAPSDDERLYERFKSFEAALRSDNVPVRVSDGGSRRTRVRALEKAFSTDSDGRLMYIRGDKLQLLMKLVGLGRRVDDKSEVDRFVSDVKNGLYAGNNPDNRTGVDIRPDITVAELDHQMFQLVAGDLLRERLTGGSGRTVFTRPVSEGGFGFGKQDLVDANEVLKRMAARTLLNDASARRLSGDIHGMSEVTAFKRYGYLPSAKTGCERLRSMAESLVHAERFRGCLAQMLATVGSSGVPNYVVSPTKGAEQFAPDVFWGALAKFVVTKLSGVIGVEGFKYDSHKSGIDNMRAVAESIKNAVTMEGKAKKNGKAPPFRYHEVPPRSFSGETLFDSVFCLDDSASDNASIMNGLVGGEAEGYLKQLFSVVSSPSIWHGWKIIDRMMSYSKAASVGMSAFFAFATRFESHVAACGLLNGLGGQARWTASLLRALDNTSFGKAVSGMLEGMGLEGASAKIPLLSDFMQLVNSDDPYVRNMRELCAFTGIPLSSSTQNPMNDAAGHIDSDIRRIKSLLEAGGHHKWAKEVDGVLKAALQNPGDYAFSNVLNCVQMAVVAQTMYRLQRECMAAERPFDPIFMLRKVAPYLSTEVGGIRAERYAWLTPAMQRVLRMAMFSWQWTMSAWTAGSGEILTDMLFGGHSTTKATRQYAFLRWMRMLGWVKVGVPVVLQFVIRGLANIIQSAGLVGDPDDPKDKDPLGIEKMPWLCFDNESTVGAFTFDVTPILKLCGRMRKGFDKMAEKTGLEQYVCPAIPWITAVGGAAAGAAMTRSVGGAAIGLGIGAMANSLLPKWTNVGNGPNTTGRRRYYMHFGKQSDEFWRWFTDAWSQATSKLAIPVQKVIEAFWGSTNGSAFNKPFHDKPLLDRFFHSESLSPNDNAIVNFFTAFTPFSFASIVQHPDAGVLGMFAPIRMGASGTALQKRIVSRLKTLALDDRRTDPWSNPANRTNLNIVCADILRESRLNGTDPKEVLNSALAVASSDLYKMLFRALPKTKDDAVDGELAMKALRGMFRLNLKLKNVSQSMQKKFKAANVNWDDWTGVESKRAVKSFLRRSYRNPWMESEQAERVFDRMFREYDRRKVRQAGKGGDGLSNFLATDDVPQTLFGVPVVADAYTEEDLEFFRKNPEAGGYYDLGE